MSGHEQAYRRLVRVYPKGFRRHYAEDLVQNFADLIQRDGPARAWARTTIDLCCTVPRYRLETIMNPKNTTLTLQLTIAGLALAGAASVLIGLYPGVLLLGVAVVYAVAQRSKLARSTRTADPTRRRGLLRVAALLALLCAAGTILMILELRDDGSWHGGKLVAYNVYFFATAFGALGYLIAGLCTPRRPKGLNHPSPAPTP